MVEYRVEPIVEGKEEDLDEGSTILDIFMATL